MTHHSVFTLRAAFQYTPRIHNRIGACAQPPSHRNLRIWRHDAKNFRIPSNTVLHHFFRFLAGDVTDGKTEKLELCLLVAADRRVGMSAVDEKMKWDKWADVEAALKKSKQKDQPPLVMAVVGNNWNPPSIAVLREIEKLKKDGLKFLSVYCLDHDEKDTKTAIAAATKTSVISAPSILLWYSERLFTIRRSDWEDDTKCNAPARPVPDCCRSVVDCVLGCCDDMFLLVVGSISKQNVSSLRTTRSIDLCCCSSANVLCAVILIFS